MRKLGIFVVAALLIAACSSGTESTTGTGSTPAGTSTSSLIVVPGADGQFSPDTRVECLGQPSFAAGALENPTLLTNTQVADGAMDPINQFLETGEGDFWPQDGYWVLENTDTSLVLAHVGEQAAVTMMASELTAAGVWETTQIASGGPCAISVPLPPDLHEVDWRFDPTADRTPESMSLSLLATGQACSSGQPMGDRLQPPELQLTETTVYVLLVATLPGGDQNCPGNPEEAVTVALGEPLGTRQVVDARAAAGLITEYLPASP